MFPTLFGLLAAGDAAEDVHRLPPTATIVLAVVLVLYLAGLTVLSVVAGRKVQTEEDYLVAGRKLSLFLCWATMIATWFGAEAITASSESARAEGLLGVVLDPFACAATFLFAGLFFAAPLWRMKLITTGDFFRRAYGNAVEIVSGCLLVPSYFGWIAIQYSALADIQRIYFGIPNGWGIFIAWAVTLAYTMIGGMWSVTLTESVQIIISLSGLVMLGYVVFSNFGDGSAIAGVDRMIEQTDPAFLTMIPPATAAAMMAYFGAWATGILGNVPGQDMQQRIFSARDEKTAVRACYLTGVTYLAFGLIPVGIGLASRIIEPDGHETGILQVMVNRYLSPVLAVVFVLSFTSMVVSATTSAVLAPATVLSHSLLGRIAVFRNSGLLLDRASVLLISLGGLSLTFLDQTKMELLDLAISLTLVSLFVPLWFGLYGRPRSQTSATLAMLVGTMVFLARWLPESLLAPMPEDVRIVTVDGIEAVDYHDYIAFERIDGFRLPRADSADAASPTALPPLTALAKAMRLFLLIPADWSGLAASFLGYFLGQVIHRRSSQTNTQALKDAWER
jgi:Na+/proline symporter